MRAPIFALLVLGLCGGAKAADTPAGNLELKQIFEADQKDREAGPAAALDWTKLIPRDTARRKRVRELIDNGALHTGIDYERASFVFQHGMDADDFLLAHVLAVTAIAKGDKDGRWIAAATLDRYLQKMGQPQVFGTQFSATMQNGQPVWTMGAYNKSLIGPALRDANCVPDDEDQAAMLAAFRKGEEPPAPKKKPCADAAGK